jgi:hypothetical protein
VLVCFAVIGGLQETIRLCKDCHDPRVLRALIKIVVTMVPYPDELVVSKGYGFTVTVYVLLLVLHRGYEPKRCI